MADPKRYFWLKLHKDFFKRKEIKRLRKIAGGDTYTIIYMEMLLRSIIDEGKLFFDGLEDDFASELALDLDEDVSFEDFGIAISRIALKHINISEFNLFLDLFF